MRRGAGLSKRIGSLSLGDLREEGIEPLALASYLATVGAGAPELAHQPRRPGRRFRSRPLRRRLAALRSGRALPSQRPAAAPALLRRGRRPPAARAPSEKLWLAVRGNIQRLADVEIWRRICEEPVAPVIECPEFAAGAAAAAARGALGRGHLGPLDRRGQAGHGPQRQGAVPSPAPGADRRASMDRSSSSAAAHRPRPGARPAAGRNRLRPRRSGMAREMRSCCREI